MVKSTLRCLVVGLKKRMACSGTRRSSIGVRCGHRHLMVLEGLEDRTVLSPTVFTVTGWGDSPADPHTPTSGDLRYCIGLANADTSNPDGSLIQFDPDVFGVPRTIAPQTGLVLSNGTEPIEISGPGASLLTVKGRGPTSNFSVFTVDSSVSISGLTITNAPWGVFNYGNLSLINVTVTGNSGGGDGDGIVSFNGGTVTLTNSIISKNSRFGVYNNGGGTATLTNTTVSGNSLGVYNDGGTATLVNTTVFGNSGAGVDNTGTATLTDTTVSGNSGIGVYNEEGGTATLVNTTVFGNSGGGVFNNLGAGNGSTATLTNVTVSGNTGGGVHNDQSCTATLTNTLVANTTSGGDISGLIIGYNNLIDDAANAGGLTNGIDGNIVGDNALLGSLGSYGGPTQTIPLLPGSPAIDAGSTVLAVDGSGNPLTTDQRGLPRVVGTAVDIGAFESSGFTLTAHAGTNQLTVVSTTFPTALQIAVTPNNAGDPVDGGVITLAAPPPSGASATLTPGNPLTIAGGVVSVNATANAIIGGPYTITASTTGEVTSASFSLTNTAPLVTSLSIVPSISSPTYGQSLTFTVTAAPGGTGDPTPTGTVQFEADGIALGAPVTLAAGSATSIGTSKLSAASHTITALYSGDAYYLANSASIPLVVTKAHLTVTADAKSMLYGGSVPALPATISGFVNGDTSSVVSGIPGLSTSANSASSVATYTITVTAGSLSAANYDFPNLVNGSLTVNKAHLTVTADAKSKLYGDSVPALTATISGFANGDTSSVVSGSPGLNTSASSASSVATYTITVAAGSLSAANYDFPNLVNGNLTVNKAHLPVTADTKSMLYGGSVPALTATISGFVNGDTSSVVSGSPGLNTSASSASSVATYTITVAAGSLSAANYDFPNLVNGNLTVNKAHLTVTADTKSTLYGGSVPALTATISGFVNGDTSSVVSGSPGLNTSASSASSVATYTITVAAGSLSAANYDFPNLVDGNLTVNKAHLTVTADTKSMLYGGSVPALTATISGFVNGDTSSAVSGIPGLSTSASSAKPVGTYAITVATGTLLAANYDFPNLVNGTLTVNKAHLTVTAHAKSMLYGGSVPALTATLSGFVNGDTASVVSGSSSLSTTATSSSTVGTYTITVAAGSLAAANYDFPNLVNGSLAINKAHLTVTANANSMFYGGSVPALTATISGFVNGDTAALVSGSSSLSTTATPSSPVGAYTINVAAGSLSAANYDFPNLINGTLTINKDHLTVTANAKSKVYGAAMPALTATVSGFVNGDTAAVVSGSAKLTTTVTTTSGVGTYRLTVAAGTLSAANYDFPNLVNGSLTVTKAQLPVTAVNKTKKRGAANPALTYTIKGFVNGDRPAVVHGKPTLRTTAAKKSPAGRYPIIVALGTLSASNYHFSLVNGTLTVH